MKWSTANVKTPDYTENHDLYVGTHTGTFKKLHIQNEENSFCQKNLQDVSQLDKDSCVTTLDFGVDHNEILIGRASKYAQVHSISTESLAETVEMNGKPIVGLARYDSFLIGGFGSGQIEKLQSPEPLILSAGTHISRLRQCATEKKLIATGGKERENNLKVFDMEVGKQIFTSKNLPHDHLQLEVPVWDSDIGFINANILTTCSRYGYIRVYDTRKQRRAVQHYANDNQMSFTTVSARDNIIYAGTTMGALKAFDTRRLKNFIHTYKGFTGSISGLCLDSTGKFLASSSLDRYVRVHDTQSCVLLYQCYVKSKAMQVLIRESQEKQEHKNDKEESSVDKDYDDLFTNMPKISENLEADDISDGEDQEKDMEGVEKSMQKRKSSIESKNTKKKKNLKE